MVDIYDILLDEKNKNPIVLVDNDGVETAFEQIAVIPYNRKLYCILKPIDKMDGVAGDEAVLFYVEDGKNEGDVNVLKLELDKHISMKIFTEYYKLLDKEILNEERRE